jgi:hypothetical protein
MSAMGRKQTYGPQWVESGHLPPLETPQIQTAAGFSQKPTELAPC